MKPISTKQQRINAFKRRQLIANSEYIVLSSSELNIRRKVLQTHSTLGSFLTVPIINTLLHLFDSNYNIVHNSTKNCASTITYNTINNIEELPLIKPTIYKQRTISDYIIEALHEVPKDTLNKIPVNISSLTINSMIFGMDDKNNKHATLIIEILKNGKKFIHFTLHLVSKTLNATNSGIIHFKKNIYHSRQYIKNPFLTYVLIKVEQPEDKLKSLHFTIAYQHIIPNNDSNSRNNAELKLYMNVILNVLNRLFDEDNMQYYIGNRNLLLKLHPKTKEILQLMNNHTTISQRKNIGTMNIINNTNNNIYQRKNKRIGTQKKRLSERTTKKRK